MIWWYQFCAIIVASVADDGRCLDLGCVFLAVSGLVSGNGHLKDVLWILVFTDSAKVERQQYFWDRKFFLSNYKYVFLQNLKCTKNTEAPCLKVVFAWFSMFTNEMSVRWHFLKANSLDSPLWNSLASDTTYNASWITDYSGLTNRNIQLVSSARMIFTLLCKIMYCVHKIL
jgi:hypothetical protein